MAGLPELGLPPYSVRVSARARRVRLVMTVERGLEVVVPRGFSSVKIPEVVESKRKWIARTAAHFESRRRLLAESPRLPERISLPAVGEEWEVEYRTAPAAPEAARAQPHSRATVSVRERPGSRLVITGDVDDFAACGQGFSRWLRRKANLALAPRLAHLAESQGLQYSRVTIRHQRSRWGSCSRRKTISLNARLLLLPVEVVDYVLIHELCHTLEMNHSPRFWAEVAARDPRYKTHRRLLREAGRSLPRWADGGSVTPLE